MEKYTTGELDILTGKITLCFYSWAQSTVYLEMKEAALGRGMKLELRVKLMMNYYLDHFFHELYELYKYFEDHKDQEILDKFLATKEERKKLQKMRNKIAHIDSNKELTTAIYKEFLRSTESSTQEGDLITMIRHTRSVLKSKKLDHHLVNNLKAILMGYPGNFWQESMLKEILG
jgi:hypothetical protein